MIHDPLGFAGPFHQDALIDTSNEKMKMLQRPHALELGRVLEPQYPILSIAQLLQSSNERLVDKPFDHLS